MTQRDATTTLRATATAAWALLGLTGIVAGATFWITAHGLYGYGVRVALLGGFAFLIPVVVDGSTLAGVAASIVNAHARLRVRIYGWCVFAFGCLCSIGGQLADADARGLPAAGWVGSVVWPVILALVSHLAVVTWRHRARPVPLGPELAEREPEAPPADPEPEAGPVSDPQDQPETGPAPDSRRKATRNGGARFQAMRAERDAVLDLYDAGLTEPGRIVERLAAEGTEVKLRTVQHWLKTSRPPARAAQ